MHQHHVHAENIGHRQVVARHGLLRKFAVEAVELIEARRKGGHHVAAGTLILLPVDIVAQSFIEHSLKLAPLAFGDLS